KPDWEDWHHTRYGLARSLIIRWTLFSMIRQMYLWTGIESQRNAFENMLKSCRTVWIICIRSSMKLLSASAKHTESAASSDKSLTLEWETMSWSESHRRDMDRSCR